MWSQGSCPLWEYVQPSLEATTACTVCSALCQGAPAALFAVILAPSNFNWWPPIAGTVRETDNQSFCRVFLYTLKSPLSHCCEDWCVLPHSFVPCTAAFSTFDLLPFSEHLPVLLWSFWGIFLLSCIWFLCNFSQLVLVLTILNNLVFLISFLTSPFSKFSVNTLNGTDPCWTVAYSSLLLCFLIGKRLSMDT